VVGRSPCRISRRSGGRGTARSGYSGSALGAGGRRGRLRALGRARVDRPRTLITLEPSREEVKFRHLGETMASYVLSPFQFL
jgi:hypothetical protein